MTYDATVSPRAHDPVPAQPHEPEKVPGRAPNALPSRLQAQMEAALGADFSDIRVHAGSSKADAVGAKAFAQGNDLHFASGEYDPASPTGQALIGHELVHVVQQRAGRVAATRDEAGGAINDDHGLEAEADRLGGAAAASSPAGAMKHASPARGATGAGGGVMQLKLGKSTGALRVRLEAGEVTLERGTRVDVNGEKVRVLSGPHREQDGTLVTKDEGVVEYEKEPKPGEHVPISDRNTIFIGDPKAIAIDEKHVTVEIKLQTRNKYDRLEIRQGYTRGSSITPLPMSSNAEVDEKNPLWGKDGQPIPNNREERVKAGYARGFDGSFKGAPSTGSPANLRTLIAKVPIEQIKAAITLGNAKSSADLALRFGLNISFGNGATGPGTRTDEEARQAYARGAVGAGHQAGYRSMSSPFAGRVDFSQFLDKLGLPAGEAMPVEAFWKQELPKHPPNNLELPFPTDYPKTNKHFLPLVPTRFLERDEHDVPRLGESEQSKDTQLKLQTRIESEATLKIADKKTLANTALQLHLLGKTGEINKIMQQDELLKKFKWTLEPTEELVFTDEYMDDKACTALKAGLGIRKRQSKTASKLNVKTGAGHHVGTAKKDGPPRKDGGYNEDRGGKDKTDIFRRHEVGFSINPEATATQIGDFLDAGKHGELSPWNLGAHEAESVSGTPINFTELETKMVLMGFRRKFNLKATPLAGEGTINIEISCDHTVGYKGKQAPKVPDIKEFQAYFAKLPELHEERFNVEMELEHLGAGGATQAQASPSTASASGGKTVAHAEHGESPESGATRLPPSGFPSVRPYQREDADHDNFNTPSFSVFATAHEKLVEALRARVTDRSGDDYLAADRQKLETLRDALKVVDSEPTADVEPHVATETASPVAPETKHEAKSGHKPIKMDGNCLYNAAIQAAGLTVTAEELRALATDTLLSDPGLVARFVDEYGSDIDRLVDTMSTNHSWAGREGDLVPVVLARYLHRPILVCDLRTRRSHLIEGTLGGEPVSVFYKNDHYEAEAPSNAQDWKTWETGGKPEPKVETENAASGWEEDLPESESEVLHAPVQKACAEGQVYTLKGLPCVGGVKQKRGTKVKVVTRKQFGGRWELKVALDLTAVNPKTYTIDETLIDFG